MSPWPILAVALYVAVEWTAAAWLASTIGWGGVVLVMLALVLLGAGVMRRAGFAATRSLRPVRYDGSTVLPGATADAIGQVGRDVSDAGWLFVAGALIALPGLVTSAAGLLLLVPPVRRLVRSRVTRSLRRRAAAAGVVF
ncbi:MAG TPA: FxsA family protein, partial [Candidatus Angelobacter sp.]|nr:FxsA family protein [Candidatus Angelobacter sp.]